MRKVSYLFLALAAALLVVDSPDMARAQMAGGGFGGGRGFGPGAFSQGGFARGFGAPRGTLAPMPRGANLSRGMGGGRLGRVNGGRTVTARSYRPPPTTVGRLPHPHPHPPRRDPHPPIIVTGPHRPHLPIVGRTPLVPPQMPQPLAPGAPPPPSGGGASPPPPPSLTAAADRNFSVPDRDERRYVPNEVILTTAADISPARLQLLENRLGLTALASTRIKLLDVDVRRYRVADNASVRGTVQASQGNSDVRSAQPNYLFELQDDGHANEVVATTKAEGADAAAKPAAVVEPARPPQYAIAAMKLEGAHKIANGDSVLIAVIDTGLDETHPEIAGMVADRFDAVGGAYRPHSHGTAMAGVIVAHKDLVGIAPKAKLLAIRAFDNVTSGSGEGTTYDILRGLDFAADHKAQIINMSFAGPRDELLSEALAKARALGMIEIAAAGNAGPQSRPLYPAAEPGVIAITATDDHNKLFAMANRGDYVAAAAPGVDVVAPGVGGAVQLSSGTSIAAAEASGVVALLLQAHPGIKSDDVRKVLSETAMRVPTDAGQPTELIDALAAVQATDVAPSSSTLTPQ